MDVLDKVYKTLIANNFIKEQALGRIKYYEYPETGDVDNPFIIIDPLDTPSPSDFADNKWLKIDCLLQIETWSLNRQSTRLIAMNIQDMMWNELGFFKISGPDEYDKETGIFRIANRYRGKLYREDFNNL